MKTTFISFIAVASAIVILLGVLYSIESSRSRKLALQLSEVKQAFEESQHTARMLELKVLQMTSVLTNSTAQLQATSARLDDAERALADMDAQQRENETARQNLGAVPPPTVTVAVGAGGKETRTFLFPSVLNRSGSALGTNMTFIQRYGRRLLFRPVEGTASIAVDVDIIHPGILAYLDIDADSAKADQLRTDAAWRAQQAAGYARLMEQQKLQQEKWEAEERIRLEQAKASAEIAKLQAEERAKLEYTENERKKADAAAKMADAAMSGALAPVNIYQNLNRPVLPVPTPRR